MDHGPESRPVQFFTALSSQLCGAHVVLVLLGIASARDAMPHRLQLDDLTSHSLTRKIKQSNDHFWLVVDPSESG